MKLLDLGKMKKIASDEKTSTFKHDDGHEIKILHDALPKIQKEQMKRLPIHKFSDGGEANSSSNSSELSYEPIDPKSSAAQASPQSSSIPPLDLTTPSDGMSGQGVPASSAPDLTQPKDIANIPAQATSQESQAADLQQKIDSAKADQALPIANQQLKNAQDNLAKINGAYNVMKAKTDDLAQYVAKNPIQENAYLENMGTGKKMSTAVGLLLGGAAGKGQGNVAQDFLNKQIDRNIQGQKDRMGQQNTVLGAYQNLFGDTQIATNLARVHQNDVISAMGNQTAARLGTSQAQANNLNMQAQIKLKNNQLLQESAGYAAGVQDGQPGQPAPSSPNGQAPAQGGGQSAGPQQDAQSGGGILHPGYGAIMNGLKYGPYKDQYPQVMEQVGNAEQAEKGMAEVDKTFPKLAAESTVRGRLARAVNPHAVAATGSAIGMGLGGPGGALIGGGIGEGLGHLPSMTANVFNDKNKHYESDQENLVKAISTSLPNLNTDAIKEAVSRNTPEQGDTPELIEKKRQNIHDLIKNSVKTNYLKQFHLTNDK